MQTIHPGDSLEVRDHDALGRVVATTDYWGSTTNYCDNLGRLSVVENAGGTVLDQRFNCYGFFLIVLFAELGSWSSGQIATVIS